MSWKSSALLWVARKRRLRGRTLRVSAIAASRQPPNVTVTLHALHQDMCSAIGTVFVTGQRRERCSHGTRNGYVLQHVGWLLYLQQGALLTAGCLRACLILNMNCSELLYIVAMLNDLRSGE